MKYFDIDIGNGPEGYQSETYGEIEKRAAEFLMERFDLRHNQIHREWIDILECDFNEETDETSVKRIPAVIELEGYHGDLKEHGTW